MSLRKFDNYRLQRADLSFKVTRDLTHTDILTLDHC